MTVQQNSLPYAFKWSAELPHVAYMDIYGRGIAEECAILAVNKHTSDVYFIPVSGLDNVDRKRLLQVLQKRDAHKYPLWDLLSNTTLKNGMNALEYFHQLVKVKAVNGAIFSPSIGRHGVAVNLTNRPTEDYTLPVPPVQAPVVAQVPAQNTVKRGPGRPPSPK